MKAITKKQIKENTVTKKGEGFYAEYSFEANVNGINFNRPMGLPCIYVTKLNENNYPVTTEIMGCETKVDFVNDIYNYFNA
jgi:hypothetical protein